MLALTVGRDLVRLGPHDFRGPVRKVATIDLPAPVRAAQPGVPTGRGRRAAAADRSTTAPRSTATRPTRGSPTLEAAVRAHPLHDSPGLAPRCGPRRRPTASSARSRGSNAASATRNESLARQFDRVLGVLEAWGYLEGWGLSPAGELLARLNTEGDLVLAESLREGLLDGLDPPALAALVSCFTYQRRGPDGNEPLPPRRWPSALVARRAREHRAACGATSTSSERDERLPETRRPDPGLHRRRSTPGRRATTSPTSSRTRR